MIKGDRGAQSLEWDEAARLELEKETIYLRERLRARVEDLVHAAGRSRATLEDIAQARRTPPGMGRRQVTGEPVPEPAWPVTFGDYRLLDPEGSVAVCTLASKDLIDRLADEAPAGVAIVGRAYTENFGIEKVVTNVVSNPRLRVLVLCGTESRHRVGETLLALHTRGLDDEGRVVSTTAPVPILRSIAPEAVRIFQLKLEMVDLRGANRPAEVLAELRRVNPTAPSPWPERWEPAVPTMRLAAGPAEIGASASRFTPDPRGLFLIGIGPSRRTIHVEHYTREGLLDQRLIGTSAEAICRALLQKGLLGDLQHSMYVGRELQKAEVALRAGVAYEQDRDVEIGATSRPDA